MKEIHQPLGLFCFVFTPVFASFTPAVFLLHLAIEKSKANTSTCLGFALFCYSTCCEIVLITDFFIIIFLKESLIITLPDKGLNGQEKFSLADV